MEGLDPYGPLCSRRSSSRPTAKLSHHVSGRSRAPIALEAAEKEVPDASRSIIRLIRMVTTAGGVTDRDVPSDRDGGTGIPAPVGARAG